MLVNLLKRGISLSIALTVFALPSVAAAESWLCIADQSTGFKFNGLTKRWESANFNVKDVRYIVKETPGSSSAWEVRQFGDQGLLPDAWCSKTFNDAGFLHCTGLGGSFTLNRNTGRFQNYFQGSFLSFNPNSTNALFRTDGGDTPFIELGKCSTI